MRDHEMDQLLAGDPEIIPSPKFTARVMSAVRTEAGALPPLPFPWAIALPGPVLSVAVMTWCVVNPVVQTPPQSLASPSLIQGLLADLTWIAQTAHVYALDWLLLAFAVVWLSWSLSVRLSGARP